MARPRPFRFQPPAAAGIAFTQVTRRADNIALAFKHSPRAETGLLYSATNTPADPPHWVKASRVEAMAPNWWRYEWRDE